MPNSNNFFLHWESRCLISPSTIPDAGHGLFVQPHKNTIRIDAHLCIYPNEVQCLKKSQQVTVHKCTLFTLQKNSSMLKLKWEITSAALLTSMESCKYFARLKKCPQMTSHESQKTTGEASNTDWMDNSAMHCFTPLPTSWYLGQKKTFPSTHEQSVCKLWQPTSILGFL